MEGSANLFGMSRPRVEAWLASEGFSLFHARGVLRALYRGEGFDLAFPRRLQEILEPGRRDSILHITQIQQSAYDHSVKFLLKSAQGGKKDSFEMVLMPEKSRLTLCISSQVGCRQACAFCHTAKMGLLRNLSAGEIVGQVHLANSWLRDHPEWLLGCRLPADQRVTNVVFMGMGEPLDNTENVIQALHILKDPFGFGLAARRLTVSTAGHLEGLRQLIDADLGVGLALSLHATDPRTRSQLMPINRRFPLAEVLSFLREYTEKTAKDVLIQYTVIAGVNDSLEDAERLVHLLQGVRVKVNLIPFNPFAESRFSSPNPENVQALHQYLHQQGVRSMVRFSKGQDIAAACGQLAVKA